MGSSCFARGNDENLDFLEQYIKENNLEAEIEVIGSCTGADLELLRTAQTL